MIGQSLNYKIGKLSYGGQGDGQLPKPVMIGVAIGGGILLLIVIGILILYRRKSTDSARVLKNMQEQMDVLELRVAAECKEAFTELQTEITELGKDPESFCISQDSILFEFSRDNFFFQFYKLFCLFSVRLFLFAICLQFVFN